MIPAEDELWFKQRGPNLLFQQCFYSGHSANGGRGVDAKPASDASPRIELLMDKQLGQSN